MTISFVVDEEGDVTEASVVKGIGAGCDEEAIRAVSEAQFKPGRHHGKNVRVKMSIPITFRLAGEATSEVETTLISVKKMMAEQKMRLAQMRKEIHELSEGSPGAKEELLRKQQEVEELLMQSDKLEKVFKSLQQKKKELEQAGK